MDLILAFSILLMVEIIHLIWVKELSIIVFLVMLSVNKLKAILHGNGVYKLIYLQDIRILTTITTTTPFQPPLLQRQFL